MGTHTHDSATLHFVNATGEPRRAMPPLLPTFSLLACLPLLLLLLRAQAGDFLTSDMSRGAGPSTSAAKAFNGSVPLDVEGYPVAPPELELEQVHVYIRHGTPPSLYMRSTG